MHTMFDCPVHYRIGSLEITLYDGGGSGEVHYRIGSLESLEDSKLLWRCVHYRVGSLETKQTIRHKE